MSIRNFDGNDFVIGKPLGPTAFAGDFVMGALYRPDGNLGSSEMTIYGLHADLNSLSAGAQICVARMGVDVSGQPFFSTEAPILATGNRATAGYSLSQDIWYLIFFGFDFSAGDVFTYIFSYDSWSLEYDSVDSVSQIAPPWTLANGISWFGAHNDAYPGVTPESFLLGDIATCFTYDGIVGSGAGAEILANQPDQSAWGITNRWPFAQAVVTDPVPDVIGSAAQTSRTGTSVVAEDPPVPYGSLAAPPQTTINSGPPTGISTDATFTFSADQGGCTFEGRLDGGAWAPITSPHTFGDIPIGARIYEVRATNPGGQIDATPASHAWTVQTPPPTVGTIPRNAPIPEAYLEETNNPRWKSLISAIWKFSDEDTGGMRYIDQLGRVRRDNTQEPSPGIRAFYLDPAALRTPGLALYLRCRITVLVGWGDTRGSTGAGIYPIISAGGAAGGITIDVGSSNSFGWNNWTIATTDNEVREFVGPEQGPILDSVAGFYALGTNIGAGIALNNYYVFRMAIEYRCR